MPKFLTGWSRIDEYWDFREAGMCFSKCVGECIYNVCFSKFGDGNCDFGCLHRTLGEMLLLPPVIAFTPTATTTHQWLAQYNTKVSQAAFLSTKSFPQLPCDPHVVEVSVSSFIILFPSILSVSLSIKKSVSQSVSYLVSKSIYEITVCVTISNFHKAKRSLDSILG